MAAFAYDPTIGACVVVGGTSAANDAALNGTWVWMGDSWLNVETSTSPAVSGGASMAFDPMSGHLTIIGAATGNNAAGPGDSWQLIWQ